MRFAPLRAGLFLLMVGCAGAPHDKPAPAVVSAADGYLDAAAVARLADAAPAPPGPGGMEDAADRATFEADMVQVDSDRWRLAQTHAELRPPLAMQHFDCPLRTRLSQSPPEALERLMTRTGRDAAAAVERAMARAFRARPIADNPDHRACVVVNDTLRAAPSHPSAHAAIGLLWGLVFAELVPEQADALERRGREIGFSRSICGLAYPADVSAGQSLAHALHAELRQSPEYQADAAAAAAEIAAARRLDGANPACAAEARALGHQGRG